jgi:hypothetical protein
MKWVIILLLSTTGLEKIELKTSGLNCGEIAKETIINYENRAR